MSIKKDSKQELRNRLSKNKLEDACDLMAFVQYASRLAALGDDTGVQQLRNEIFLRPEFAENLPEILKTRCDQGIWETEEYPGEDLALSLIDAQDFHCFSARFPDILTNRVSIPSGARIELRIFFDLWWEACENAELDEDAAEMLRDFLKVYPIPEEERLPVVNTPITEWEYALLDRIYAGVELPVTPAQWNVGRIVAQPPGRLTTPAAALPPPIRILALADGTTPKTLQEHFQSGAWSAETQWGTVCIELRVNNHWVLFISIADLDGDSVPVDRIRLGAIPAFRDEEDATLWKINLKRFTRDERERLLNKPLVVQMSNGEIVQCGAAELNSHT
jgi:hypothetical protein